MRCAFAARSGGAKYSLLIGPNNPTSQVGPFASVRPSYARVTWKRYLPLLNGRCPAVLLVAVLMSQANQAVQCRFAGQRGWKQRQIYIYISTHYLPLLSPSWGPFRNGD